MNNKLLPSGAILFVLCFGSVTLFGQNVQKRFSCPFEKGIVVKYNVDSVIGSRISDPDYSVEIIGQETNVMSSSSGKVFKMIRIDSSVSIIIKSGDYVFAYIDLDMALVQEGQNVTPSNRIGISKSKSIRFKISEKDRILIHPEKVIACLFKNK